MTHYEVLGVAPDAEPEVIQAAYRALMKKYHPDAAGCTTDARAKKINAAYAVLSDASLRAAYDAKLRHQARPEPEREPDFTAPRSRARANAQGESLVRYRIWAVGTAAVVAIAVYLKSTPSTPPEQQGWKVISVSPAPEPPAASAAQAAADQATLSPANAATSESAAATTAQVEGSPGAERVQASPETPLERARPDLAGLSTDERQSVESACYGARVSQGPAAYYRCADDQLAALRQMADRPDFSGATSLERVSIESACYGPKVSQGPAAYYRCATAQLRQLRRSEGAPVMGGLSQLERESIDSACYGARVSSGPAAYYDCVRGKIADLGQ